MLFKEIIIFPELFLGISIVYLVVHCTFLTKQKTHPLLQNSILYLSVLSLFFSIYLVFNEPLNVLELSCLNNTVINDYSSFLSKLIIGTLALFCLLMMQPYILNQKITKFEYFLLILFGVLGLFLLCSSNDLLTAYLSIELQSLSFYVLAAFKKNSTFSVDAGIKYFILGAFASSMFLFGSSLLYGITGTVNFDDFHLLFVGDLLENNLEEEIEEFIASVELYNIVVMTEFELEDLLNTCGFSHSPFFDQNILNLIGFNLSELRLMNPNFVNFCESLYTFHLEVLDMEKELLESLFMEDNLQVTEFSNNINLIKFALVFILIGLFFKITVAPFHIWAPDVYEGSPTSSTFFFSVVPKLAIFVLLLRIFYYSFFSLVESWRYFVVLVIIFSIIVGSFGGLEQRKVKSLLVYSTISHMGYSLISFSAGTFESLQMLISYLIIYSFSGLCVWSIFLVTRLKNNYFQKQNKDLTDLVLLGKSNYMLAVFFTTVLFSIAGFPPMIGFLVKMGIFLTAMESGMFFVALITILCSVIGTFYYIRLIKILYFEKVLVGKLYYPINFQSSVLITCLFFILLFLFVNPTLLFLISHKFSLLLFF